MSMKNLAGASHGAPYDPGPSGSQEFPNVSPPLHWANHSDLSFRGGLTTHGAPGQ
ncbi:unnamed protein product [Staurois parvus]|uniref:Uncharacterized protein n=1 Tax=Staurois parvus TaxID=386267 RepID=A0ABN9DE83_9NEOB|nr:unnamed protein product [Staurois parvus]